MGRQPWFFSEERCLGGSGALEERRAVLQGGNVPGGQPAGFTEEQWTRADGILEKLREQKWTAARVLFGLRGEVRSLFSGAELFDGKKAGEAFRLPGPNW